MWSCVRNPTHAHDSKAHTCSTFESPHTLNKSPHMLIASSVRKPYREITRVSRGCEGPISQNVFIGSFSKVNSPTEWSTYCLLLLIKILNLRFCGGVEFLKLTNKYIASDKIAGGLSSLSWSLACGLEIAKKMPKGESRMNLFPYEIPCLHCCRASMTVRAMFWPWLSGKSPLNLSRHSLFARKR